MARGPVAVDTDVYSARLLPDSPLALRYEPLLAGRLEVLSFQPVAELRYGALLRGWETFGSNVLRRPSLAPRSCRPVRNADRWIAAIALRLGISLVSNDRIFEGTPALAREAVPPAPT